MNMRAPARLPSTPYIRKLKRLSDHVEPGTPSNQFLVAFVVFTSSKGISHATSPAASGQAAAAAAAAVHESQSAKGAAQKARAAPIPRGERMFRAPLWRLGLTPDNLGQLRGTAFYCVGPLHAGKGEKGGIKDKTK